MELEDRAQIVVRLGTVGLQRQRGAAARFRGIELAERGQRDAQIVMRVGVVGGDRQGAPVAFGGGPIAAAAIVAVIDTIDSENLLENVTEREAQIRQHCVTGPVVSIQGMGLLLGLVCQRPAVEIRDALLEHDILTGTSADPSVLRLLPPLILQSAHVARLANALDDLEFKS